MCLLELHKLFYYIECYREGGSDRGGGGGGERVVERKSDGEEGGARQSQVVVGVGCLTAGRCRVTVVGGVVCW